MDSKQLSLFDLISFKNIPDKIIPSNIHLKGKEIWCPYCSSKVLLKKDQFLGVKKCPICGITEKDYWIKKLNKKL